MKTGLKLFLISGICHSAGIAQSLTSINPNNGRQSQSLSVTILGQNTHFAQGSGTTGTTSVRFTRGQTVINASSFSATSNTSLGANFNLSGTAAAGLWNVEVVTGQDGLLTLQNGFTINLGAPTNLTARAQSGSEMILEWTDHSGTAQSFKIERKLGMSGTYQQIAIVGGDTTLYFDPQLMPQSQYCYRVRAFEGNNNSVYSNEACATTLTPPRITSVNPNSGQQNQSLSVTIVGQNTRFAQGSATESVWFARGNARIFASSFTATSNTSVNANFNLPGAASTGLWDVQVQTTLNGLLALANGFTINLGVPQNLNATSISGAQINLTWSDRSGTEEGFKIERRLGTGGAFEEIAVADANANVFEDHPLSALTQYCYRIRAFSGNNNSGYSNQSCATTQNQARLISINPNRGEQSQYLTINILGENTNFTQGGSTMSVRLARGNTTINASSFTPVSHASLNADFDLPSAAVAGAWDVQVHSNIDGLLTLQNGFTLDLGSPANLVASPVANDEILLQWNDRSGTELGFEIERMLGTAGAFALIATLGTEVSSFRDRGLDPVTQYCYRLRAFSGVSNSAYSNQSCATTFARPEITAVNPSQAEQAQSLTLVISGQNTHFAQGSATQRVWLGRGGRTIEALRYSQLNNTTLSADFSIPPSAQPGLWNVSVHSDIDGSLTLDNGFEIRLAAPSQLFVTALSTTEIELGWQDNSGTEHGYRLERKRGGTGVYQERAVVPANVTTFSDSGLGAATEYCYRVRAFDLMGVSDYAAESCDTTAVVSFVNISASLPGVHLAAAAWGDYDNDGDLDILLCGENGIFPNSTPITKIYRNQNGAFIEHPASFAAVTSGDLAWGDYDNDNDLDILLSGNSNPEHVPVRPVSKIYENRNGDFVDRNAGLFGVWSGSTSWSDFDNDGDLDILLTGLMNDTAAVSRIYRNEPAGFVEFDAKLPQIHGFAVWGDYDLDGDLDILIAGSTNMFLPSSQVLRNDTATNEGFVDIHAGLPGLYHGSGAWGDFDNDGDLDILLSGSTGIEILTRIYRNELGGFLATGIFISGSAGEAAWGDHDNDGDLDLLVAGSTEQKQISRVYRNDGTSFVDIGASLLGIGFSGAAVWGDYDNDSDLDILLAGYWSTSPPAAPVTLVYRNIIAGINTLPEPPGNLSAVVSGSSVSFNWSKSQDAQTAQPALTYNLRVGSFPGGENIVSPMANPSTGYRRQPQLGNVNHRNSWTIKNLAPGTYYWSAQAVDNAFAGSIFALEESLRVGTDAVTEEAPEESGLPVDFALHANYPNPFNSATRILYSLPRLTAVRLEIFDHLGRRVRTLVHADQNPDDYSVTWDGRNDEGEVLPSGIYLYRLTAGEFMQARKMLFLK